MGCCQREDAVSAAGGGRANSGKQEEKGFALLRNKQDKQNLTTDLWSPWCRGGHSG